MLPRRAAADCEPCNNLNDGDIVDYVMLYASLVVFLAALKMFTKANLVVPL
jgi:hypothetical protein